MKIDDKYKWLARDKDGELCAYEDKPFKEQEDKTWDNEKSYFTLNETDSTYSFIKWNDDEPWSIEEVEDYLEAKKEFKQASDSDSINKPLHYHSNGIDVIGFAEAQFSKEEQKGFYRINAIKYLTRYDKKGTPEDDLQKADFYLRKLIELNRS